jgi:chitinase
VAAGHAQGQNVKLSVGGWTGSAYFSRAVGSVAGRAKLCHSMVNAYHKFNLDGIDIDWEYPNQAGAGNEHSPDDTANFYKFLSQLRKKLPSNARITTATQVWPWADKNGAPLTNVSNFAQVLDWVLIMNYDIWGCE